MASATGPNRDVPRRRGDLCSACVHYFVTWERRQPHGCRAMGFKSAKRPCLVVHRSSGAACRSFVEKPDRNRASGSRD